MITFLEYVNIRRHNKEWQFAADGYIPLSPSILKEFERDVKGVYHVTDIEGLQKLAKLEGKRVDIATFSKGSKGLSGGLLRTAEVLVTLDGKSSIDFAGDVASKVDRNGVILTFRFVLVNLFEKDKALFITYKKGFINIFYIAFIAP